MSFGNKSPATATPVLAGIDVSAEPTNQESTPIAYVAGEYLLPASWVSNGYNQRAVTVGSGGSKSKGSSSNATKQLNYFATIVCIWHVGQGDKFTGIIIEDRLVWHGLITRPTNGALYTDVTIENRGIYRHYWGTTLQTTVDPHLVASANDYAQDHPAYNGICYGILIDFLFGLNKTTAPSIKLRGERTPVQPFYSGVEAQNSDGQANPFCVLAELCTNEWYGLAQPTGWFATTKWAAAIVAAYARRNLCYCSPLIDQQSSVKSLATDLFLLCDGFIRAESGTGLIEAGMFTLPEAIDPDALLMLDSTALLEVPQFTPDTWDDVSNTWTVTFRDRDYVFKTNSVKDSDINGLDTIGDVRGEELQRKAIVRLAQAQNYAAEWKRRHSVPGNRGTIKVRAELIDFIQPGDHLRTDIDSFPGGLELQQVFRVLSITRTVKGVAELTLEAERTLAPIAYLPLQAPLDPQIPEELPDIGQVRFFETPWLNYAVGVLASRPSQIVTDFLSYYDDVSSGTFPFMARSRSYALPGQLHSALTVADTGPFLVDLLGSNNRELISSDPGDTAARDDTLLMVVLHLAPNGQIAAAADDHAWVEVFSCSAFVVTAPNQISVTALRSRQVTHTRAFNTTDEVWFVRRADLPVIEHADFAGLAGNSLNAYFKLQPAALYAERSLADCALRTFNFALNREYTYDSNSILVLGTCSTIPNFSFAGYTLVIACQVTITSPGGRRTISISGIAGPNTESDHAVLSVGLYRDDTQIASLGAFTKWQTPATLNFSQEFSDTPAAGAHTYSVRAQAYFLDNASYSSGLTAQMTIT